jgi:SpoVK/Ycf46/Vps4 family AAA+-type ATPase
VAFLCEYPPSFVAAVSLFRAIEKDRPCVCVFEDIDTLIECHGDAELLQWLDGAYQIDRVVNIATTNYPEQLDRRIVTRPRRFDRIVKISAITAEARRAYFQWKLPKLTSQELECWVDRTDGLSFAALSEVVIRTVCLGADLEGVVEMLRAMEERPPSSSDCKEPAPMGFRPARERNGSRRSNRS